MSAIGTNDISTVLRYIVYSYAFLDLEGELIDIVGNVSNNQREFSPDKMTVDSLRYFSMIDMKDELPTSQLSPWS